MVSTRKNRGQARHRSHSTPSRWTAEQVDDLKIPLLEEVEASGEWLWVRRTKISWQSFWHYVKTERVTEGSDFEKKLVRAKKPRGTIVVPLLVRTAVVESLVDGK